MTGQGLETHQWIGNYPRDFEIEGKPIVLFRCPVCERNFARETGDTEWRAARVETFRVEYLPETVSDRWVSEPCPGTQAADIELSWSRAKVSDPSIAASEPEKQPKRRIARKLR
jgi:hypothetical protein